MTPQDFAYWLKGFMEIENPKKLDEKQTQIIKDHLDLVFEKQTPDRGDYVPSFQPSSPFPGTTILC